MEVAVREMGREISCIMSDAFCGFAGKLAEEMDVPWVPLWTAGPRSLLVHVDTDEVRQRLGNTGKYLLEKIILFVFYCLIQIYI